MITKAFATKLIGLLDLTRLEEQDTATAVSTFCRQALTPLGPVAAVCVYPQYVTLVKNILKDSTVKIATVANFPSGREQPDKIFKTIQSAIDEGADEIDLVIPFHDYLNAKTPNTTALVSQAKSLCGETHLLKCILETGALISPDLIIAAAVDAMEGGADFLKTSTGKHYPGASLTATEILLHLLKNYHEKTIGLKISGGIKTPEQAREHINQIKKIYRKLPITANYVRFGASSLLAEILQARTLKPKGD